jgi:Bacterial membrane protein YfhO
LKLPSSDGDSPFMLRRMLTLRKLIGVANYWERQIPVHYLDSPLLRMLNVGWLAGTIELQPSEVRSAGLSPAGRVAGLYLYQIPRALPRFFLVPYVHKSSGPEESCGILSERMFDPASEAAVEGITHSAGELGQGGVTVNDYEPNSVRLSVRADGPAFLASSEAFYPGWTATVNGKAAQLFMTNGAFRGLWIPAGTNQVVMTYNPKYLLASAAISLLTLLAAAAAICGEWPGGRLLR